jgi:(2Fe-2S) ferredoxin
MKRYRLSVCKGPVCRPGGSDRVFQVARDEVASRGLAEKCQVARGGCYGLCHLGPNLIVREDVGRPKDPLSREDFQLMGWEGECHYGAMTEEKVRRVIGEHIAEDHPVPELFAVDDELESA